MIYTVTLNPAVDYFVTLDSLHFGEVNRAKKEHKAPGGKGINVSRVLKRLGHESEAVGFIGGFTGGYIKDAVEAESIRTHFVTVDGDTRINVKMKAESETELNGTSPVITADNVRDLEAFLQRLGKGDAVVLAGSLPPSLDKTIYTRWTKRLREQGVAVYVDTSGVPLKDVLSAKPSFIKPNHRELAELVGADIHTPAEAVPYAKELLETGIENVLVSFAGGGALLSTRERTMVANTPKGVVKNSVGAGDSVVAGFVCANAEGMDLPEAFRFAVASGSATAFSTGFADRERVEELKQQVSVTYID
ncbi:1-phosphofructokinase [Shouchella shacheensis]|uniref:1-phosphofructokinase n=1 Tax=Shouchella shacheensis TaxID=1649580 RepID=UPI00073FDF44|nr:1-phosphofructokinase [Shouchella shacheensis]